MVFGKGKQKNVAELGRKGAIACIKKHGGFKKGSKNCNWNNGRSKDIKGYVRILKPNHPHATANGGRYVFEHRLVMEKHLGRFLKPKELVHHINGKRDDNRIKNLMLFRNRGEHLTFHNLIKSQKKRVQ